MSVQVTREAPFGDFEFTRQAGLAPAGGAGGAPGGDGGDERRGGDDKLGGMDESSESEGSEEEKKKIEETGKMIIPCTDSFNSDHSLLSLSCYSNLFITE